MITLKELTFNPNSDKEFMVVKEVTEKVRNGCVDVYYTSYDGDEETCSIISLDIEDVKMIASVFGCKVVQND